MPGWHVAQLNIARMVAPLDHPSMIGFVQLLEPVNAIADHSPGFIWRLETEEGDASSIRAFDDDRILVNLSVWESVEALHAFTYKGDHLGPLRRRRDWFEPVEGPSTVLWWVEVGRVPSVAEAKARLDLLIEQGPTLEAFTFRNPFPPPTE
jgi:hypothetical protein